RSAPCSPSNIEQHWYFPVVRLTAVLAPARRYDASLFALDSSVTDFDAVDWGNQPTLYQFTFRTSQWPTFAAHLASYIAGGALDEVVPAPAPFADLAAAVGTTARVVDDAILATAMGQLGLPPRDPAERSELVRLWQSTTTGDQLVGLLLDG